MTTPVRRLTSEWVCHHLAVGERIVRADALSGGITAEVSKLTIGASDGVVRDLVLRSYVEPRALPHAEEWLTRESEALELLVESRVSAPSLVAVDPTAMECEYPSILMTHLPGRTILDDDGVESRIPLLARQLVAIHALRPGHRLPEYQALTTADTVVVPASANPESWAAAVDLIRGSVPRYQGRILHRDFQPGNVLFGSADAGDRITGVVDWSGMCWGPADLDVAHCSTNLALLHGPEWGLRFSAAYEQANGVLAATARARQYWRVRDALSCSEEVQLWAAPWRAAGRADLTPTVVEDRLDVYLSILMRDRP